MSGDGTEPVSCVKVTPEQFRIEVVLNEEVFLELLLTNTSDDLCTFKVKTTARDRYLLRPTQDYIQPHSSRVCKIVMSALRTYPDLSNPKNLKDKFLVQATTLEREVPDLTKMWKDLETQHNPKAGIYKYAETKIKCKLSIPAKYRAADATKRGLEEEALAAAAADKGAEQAQQQQQQQPQSLSQQQMQSRMNEVSAEDEFAAMVLAPTSEPVHAVASAQPAAPAANTPAIVASSSSNALTQPSSSSAALPNVAPSSSASSATSAAAVSGSNNSSSNSHPEGSAPPSLAHQLKASEAKYAELMAFIVQTTQELEKERLDKEGAEARAQQAAQQLAQGLARLEATEAKLLQAREELKRAAAESARKNGGGDDESSADGVTRRRGKDSEDDDSRAGKKLSPAAVAAAAASATSPSSLSSSAASSPRTATKSPPGLSLAFWQIALLALVCFVLGKIFG